MTRARRAIFFFDSVNRQYKTAYAILTGHGGVAPNGAPSHVRNERHQHGRPGTRTILRSCAGRQMDMDIGLFKMAVFNVEQSCPVLYDTERRLCAFTTAEWSLSSNCSRSSSSSVRPADRGASPTLLFHSGCPSTLEFSIWVLKHRQAGHLGIFRLCHFLPSCDIVCIARWRGQRAFNRNRGFTTKVCFS